MGTYKTIEASNWFKFVVCYAGKKLHGYSLKKVLFMVNNNHSTSVIAIADLKEISLR